MFKRAAIFGGPRALHLLQTTTMVYHTLAKALRANKVPTPVADLKNMLDELEEGSHPFVLVISSRARFLLTLHD